MWKPDDDFWLEEADNTESVLLVALGQFPLRITATDADSGASRDGYIDVTIVTFDRAKNQVRGRVVANTTGHRFDCQVITLTLDERSDTETCAIHKIDGIKF
jgi:hypothetical protein